MKQEAFAYVKGKWVSCSEPGLACQERGFRFGDGVFETIAVQQGIPYQWEVHHQRLIRGLETLRIPLPDEDIRQCCLDILQKNEVEQGFVRLSISRGIGSRGYLPVPPPSQPQAPTVVIETLPPVDVPRQSVDLWRSQYTKPLSSAIPAGIKTMQGLNSTLARLEAQEHGCFEALLTTPQGDICEGSSSNIFWFAKGVLYTPSLDCPAVAGTTRAAILRVSPYPILEGCYSLDDLRQADEVFLTNVAWGVLPVRSLKPSGLTWQSTERSLELNTLLAQDIARYVATQKN